MKYETQYFVLEIPMENYRKEIGGKCRQMHDCFLKTDRAISE